MTGSSKAVTAKVEGSKLVISLPLVKPPRPSKSGKSLTVATTSGNIATDVIVDGKPVVVGVNAYISAR